MIGFTHSDDDASRVDCVLVGGSPITASGFDPTQLYQIIISCHMSLHRVEPCSNRKTSPKGIKYGGDERGVERDTSMVTRRK
jgi:hypothetical protein